MKKNSKTAKTAVSKAEEELRLSEARLESLLRIAQLRDCTTQELLDFALNEAIQLTGSRIGYIYHYHEEREEFVLNTWSKGVMEVCSVMEQKTVYALKETGIWGEAVRQRRPILLNDFAAPHPQKKGYPAGHAPLSRFLTIPVFRKDRIVAVVAVANKDDAYNETDIRQLTLLMDQVWRMVVEREQEEALHLQEESYRNLFDHMLSGFALHEIILDAHGRPKDYRYLAVNPAFERLTGLKAADLVGKTVLEVMPDTEPEWIDKYGQVALTGNSIHFEQHSRVLNRDYEITAYRAASGQFACIFKDVTESKALAMAQRNAMDELDKSEKRYRRITETITDYIYTVRLENGNTVGTQHGAGCEAITGFSDEDYARDSNLWLRMVPEEEKEGLLAHFRRLAAGKEMPAVEHRIIRRDGQIRWVSNTPVFRRDATGKITGYDGLIHDITERKLAEEEIRRLSSFPQLSPFPIIEITRRGALTYANPAARNLMMHLDLADHRELLPADLEELFRIAAESNVIQVFRDIKVRGRVFSLSISFASGFDTLRLYFTDITERRQAESELAAEKERLMVTLRSIGDGVITTSIDGRVTLMNNVAEELTGWRLEEALDRPLQEVFNIINEETKQAAESPVEKVLKTDGIVGLANHTALVSRNGTTRVIADSGAPIRDSEGVTIGVVLVFRDITNKRRTDEALQNAEKLESLAILAGGIAHDFNNLLSGIFGYVDMAQKYVQKGDLPRVSSLITNTLESFERAKNLTQQLLTFSKGGTPIRKTQSVATLLRKAVDFVCSGSNVDPVFDIPAGEWLCDVDENQLGQVIDNIVINARQAMPLGGKLHVSLASAVSSQIPAGLTDTEYFRISIRDHGTGIAHEHLSKIFDPFFTTKQQGSGLGLATSYSIIKRHEGIIEVTSELGKGTVFHIYLPASHSAIESGVSAPDAEHTGQGRILVMDDEVVLQELICLMLADMGYETDTASHGEEALAKVKAAAASGRPYAAAILDLTIPAGMGGKNTVKPMLELDSAIKIIASSGYAEDPVMAMPQSFGFVDRLIKPYRINELAKVLQKVMG